MKGGSMRICTEFSHLGIECLHTKQNRIGLLGGTFNPVHNGHISMAYIVLYEFLLNKVVFLPSGNPPHKKNEYIAPAAHRLDMLHLATENEPRFCVSTAEIDRGGVTYTVDTLELLMRKNADEEYYYIIGADTLFELKTWRNFERVMRLVHFICVLRPGQDDQAARNYAKKLNDAYCGRIEVAEERGPDISSSLIRQLAASQKPCSGLVPDKVGCYLQQNRVYFNED
jgi:nicotinate-nucleotide adenylyltransferase